MNDTYKTIAKPTNELLFKEKNSKFFGYAFPVLNENQIQNYLLELKKTHSSAGHFCYAWKLGTEVFSYKVNDDGEPKNSAGLPIYGQIQSFDVTNIFVVVVRYFGGTKLGVGGLIQAYKTTAQITLEESEIIEKTINTSFQLEFHYEQMSVVMKFIKEQLIEIENQEMRMKCKLDVRLRKSEVYKLEEFLEKHHKIKSTKLKI